MRLGGAGRFVGWTSAADPHIESTPCGCTRCSEGRIQCKTLATATRRGTHSNPCHCIAVATWHRQRKGERVKKGLPNQCKGAGMAAKKRTTLVGSRVNKVVFNAAVAARRLALHAVLVKHRASSCARQSAQVCHANEVLPVRAGDKHDDSRPSNSKPYKEGARWATGHHVRMEQSTPVVNASQVHRPVE